MSDQNFLVFPSGRSVGQVKKDAKRLAKAESIPLHAAQDRLVRANGMCCGWSDAIQNLKKDWSRDIDLIIGRLGTGKTTHAFNLIRLFERQNVVAIAPFAKDLADKGFEPEEIHTYLQIPTYPSHLPEGCTLFLDELKFCLEFWKITPRTLLEMASESGHKLILAEQEEFELLKQFAELDRVGTRISLHRCLRSKEGKLMVREMRLSYFLQQIAPIICTTKNLSGHENGMSCGGEAEAMTLLKKTTNQISWVVVDRVGLAGGKSTIECLKRMASRVVQSMTK